MVKSHQFAFKVPLVRRDHNHKNPRTNT